MRRAAGVAAWIGIASLATAGCAVGPTYQPRAPSIPASWEGLVGLVRPADPSVALSVATSAEGDSLKGWWKRFADPMLDQIIDRAVAANLDLRRAGARVREARAARTVAFGGLLPEIDATGSYVRSRASEHGFSFSPDSSASGSGSAGSFAGGPGTETSFYQAGFDASWELDVFGGRRRALEAANADLQAADEDRRDVLVTLLGEVARNYVELRAAQRQLRIAEQNLAAETETLDITRMRFDAGLTSGLDVARAEAQVATTKSGLPTLKSAERRSIHALNLLLGEEPNARERDLGGEVGIPPPPPRVPVGLPSELLRRRPDVRRAERQLAAATARVGVATADLFPKFSLTGSLGLQSVSTSDFFAGGSRAFSVGPTVRWPILDLGRIRGNIAVQNAREESAAAAYEQAVLASLRDVEDALVSFANEQDRRSSLASAVEANRQAAALAADLYKQGRGDFLSVLQAERDLYASQDALAQSDRSVASNLVALYKALGGGWDLEAPGDPAPSAHAAP